MSSDPGAFTPSSEQLVLRKARRLKKQKAATNANTDAASATTPSSPVNNEKGQIVTRPWLAVQPEGPSPPNASRRVKIMTWNVRSYFNFYLTSAVCTALDRHMATLHTY